MEAAEQPWAEGLLSEVCGQADTVTGLYYRYWVEVVEAGEIWRLEAYPPWMVMCGCSSPMFDREVGLNLTGVLGLVCAGGEVQGVTCTSEKVEVFGVFEGHEVVLTVYFVPPKDTEVVGRLMEDGSFVALGEGYRVD